MALCCVTDTLLSWSQQYRNVGFTHRYNRFTVGLHKYLLIGVTEHNKKRTGKRNDHNWSKITVLEKIYRGF